MLAILKILKKSAGCFAALLFILAACLHAGAGVLPGIDVVLRSGPDMLAGKRVGLITNHTGLSRELRSSIDLLHEHPGVNLAALFAPEHGLRGLQRAGRYVPSFRDENTGLTVYSLYGRTRIPTEEMLGGVDVLVFDIQDIGTRWYTYISTMANAMTAAARYGKEFVVLDRPNPLGGIRIEGPVLEDVGSFIGMYRVPVVHGMTIGELALFYKYEHDLDLDLTVVRMEGWERRMNWDETGLKWVPTSPHIPSFESTIHYPGFGLLGETGVVSVGVGYTLPFQVAAAPWMSAEEFSGLMNAKNLPDVIFRPAHFSPFAGMFQDEHCEGIQAHVTGRGYRPLETALIILETLRDAYPEQVKREFNSARQGSFNRHLGTPAITEALLTAEKLGPVIRSWDEDLESFRQKREKYLLY